MSDWRDDMCEIAECELCDDDGTRLGGIGSCDHTDYGAIAKRGIKLVLQALKEAKQ